jgi:tetratricopeptide (TPR) repeat protein
LAGQGQFDEAIGHFRKALEIKPDFALAHFSLGNALAVCQRRDEALQHYQSALGLASAQNDLALADAVRTKMTMTGASD